jgi:arginyl-tRNA--protein-N-Asp/Glu arginylyltransferase
MKICFSEGESDYKNYIFPYAVWALREKNDVAADFFPLGFLPSAGDLSRFYLCRQLRVLLPKFAPTSENRRVLKKNPTLEAKLMEKKDFEFTPERRKLCEAYAAERFGPEVMPWKRIRTRFDAPMTSHVILYTLSDTLTGKSEEVGIVFILALDGAVAFYSNAFYNLKYFKQSLGMAMMIKAAEIFHAGKFGGLYLGSCYSSASLYKTNFSSVEFFNGNFWSGDMDELKYILRRSEKENPTCHLLEDEGYLKFHGGNLGEYLRKVPAKFTLA